MYADRWGAWILGLLVGLLCAGLPPQPIGAQDLDRIEAKLVKVVGAGGFRGLEAYQTGFFVSPTGDVLTPWSHVLAGDRIQVVLSDGQRLSATLSGYDPVREIALLKTQPLVAVDWFERVRESLEPAIGSRLLIFSNAFGLAVGEERLSFQSGSLAGRVRIDLGKVARSESSAPLLLLDAITSNPGAAGGAVVDAQGRLVGMLGKERRDPHYRIWINYALPAAELWAAVDQIQSGELALPAADNTPLPQEPLTFELLGLEMVPPLFASTPPYVDSLRPGSAAQRGGLRSDDLILSVAGKLTPDLQAVAAQLRKIDRDSPVVIEVRRGNQILSLPLRLTP